VSQASRARKKI